MQTLRLPALPALLAILTLTAALLALGCSTTEKPKDTSACGASACGSEACGSDPCGGSAEGGLTAKFPNWKAANALKGDPANGRKYFESKMFDSLMTCTSCHSFDQGDTMDADAGGKQHAGYSVWGASHRTNIKNSGGDIAALGANVCVTTWMGGPKEGMSAQELADMQAFLETGGGTGHATSKNVPYANSTYTIPKDLTGGDPLRGREMVINYCNNCHGVEDTAATTGDVDKTLKPNKVPAERLDGLTKRIRDKFMQHNEYMPGFSDQRMPEKDLLDILAFFEKK